LVVYCLTASACIRAARSRQCYGSRMMGAGM
jgi:hypothetical protein